MLVASSHQVQCGAAAPCPAANDYNARSRSIEVSGRSAFNDHRGVYGVGFHFECSSHSRLTLDLDFERLRFE